MLGIFRKRTSCFCAEDSVSWSWPFTRAHERYHDFTVTTVTCMKHPWSVRLYDPQQMRFVKVAEERKILRQLHAVDSQAQQAKGHALLFGLE
jgi:hypothetical protein